jgi:hypothetical protein
VDEKTQKRREEREKESIAEQKWKSLVDFWGLTGISS